jgi:hypothetical protein
MQWPRQWRNAIDDRRRSRLKTGAQESVDRVSRDCRATTACPIQPECAGAISIVGKLLRRSNR